jgi:RNase P/RNase MRP subunit POP5
MVRFKNRYLTFSVRWGDEGAAKLTPSAIAELLRTSLAMNFGAHGRGGEERSLQVKYFDAQTGVGLVRCSREGERRVWASMTFINETRGRGVVLAVLKSSGSIRCAKRQLLRVWQAARRRPSTTSSQKEAARLVDDPRIAALTH